MWRWLIGLLRGKPRQLQPFLLVDFGPGKVVKVRVLSEEDNAYNVQVPRSVPFLGSYGKGKNKGKWSFGKQMEGIVGVVWE